jgi:hypothetical protein
MTIASANNPPTRADPNIRHELRTNTVPIVNSEVCSFSRSLETKWDPVWGPAESWSYVFIAKAPMATTAGELYVLLYEVA